MSRITPQDSGVRGVLDVIVFASLAALCCVIVATVNIVDLASPSGVAVSMPVVADTASLELDGSGAPDVYVITEATVLVAEIATPAMAAFVASILFTAATALTVLFALVRLAFAIRSAQFFSRVTVRTLNFIGAVLFIGPGLAALADAFARSGAYRALGVPYDGMHLLDFIPTLIVWVVALAVAMLAQVFDRGRRMQHDTRGLV
ncbi:DUF2975 domain-containing protein [Microbacterium koreense]|uniref:DUF2975 domain-containing protein n=1 Tax=Microbacterium koreense TaxID=323761 RepID=A0ABW2ZPU0_9MICO